MRNFRDEIDSIVSQIAVGKDVLDDDDDKIQGEEGEDITEIVDITEIHA